MKLTKKLLCLMLVLALTFALCACGDNKKDDKQSDSTVPPVDNGSTAPSTQTTVDSWDGNLEGDSQFNDGMFGEW